MVYAALKNFLASQKQVVFFFLEELARYYMKYTYLATEEIFLFGLLKGNGILPLGVISTFVGLAGLGESSGSSLLGGQVLFKGLGLLLGLFLGDSLFGGVSSSGILGLQGISSTKKRGGLVVASNSWANCSGSITYASASADSAWPQLCSTFFSLSLLSYNISDECGKYVYVE